VIPPGPHRVYLRLIGTMLIAAILTVCGISGLRGSGDNPLPNAGLSQGPENLPGSDSQQPVKAAGISSFPGIDAIRPDRFQRCRTPMLSGSLHLTGAGAGQRYAELVLRNSSNEACSLYGYSGLQLIDSNGTPLPTRVKRTENPGPSLLTIPPAGEAKATLHWSVVPSEGEPVDRPCQPTPAATDVTPPDETNSLRVRWVDGAVCGFGSIDESAYHQ
jgi:hypothetical protein